jgi:ATP-dependent DNA ligase
MDLIEALEKLENTPRGDARKDAITTLSKECPDLVRYFNYCFSEFITFGMKKIPTSTPGGAVVVNPHKNDKWFSELETELLIPLSNRDLTGNAAKSAVNGFRNKCTGNQWKWTERVILQDPRLNFNKSTVNKAVPGSIEDFKVALAEKIEDVSDKHLNNNAPYIVMPKLDGVRCMAWLPGKGKEVVLRSRSGQEYFNFESIRKSLQEYNDKAKSKPYWFDGEIICRDQEGAINFQMLQHSIHRDDATEIGKLEYIVFDAYGTKDPALDVDSFSYRLKKAGQYVKEAKLDNVFIVESMEDSDVNMPLYGHPDARKNIMTLAKTFVDKGYEGLMLRSSQHAGKLKRSNYVMKVKFFLDDEAKVVDIVEGKGRLVGTLGKFVCKHKNGKTFDCGSGLSDAQRKKYWNKNVIGKMITYKYFETTDDGLPRFPIFKAFRSKKDV